MKIFKSGTFWFFVIFIAAAVLRLYRLPEYVHFLGDEGRDALVVKRMIVDRDFTLLGPTASVGGFYIGGLYYYFMLPFLFLWKLDPVGPAYMAVLFGLGTIALTFYLCKSFFNQKVGLIAAFLMAISPQMVYISRFSWNPNPMPFFTLLLITCLYLSATKGKKIFTLFAGLSLGVLFELHYIDLALAPIVAIMCLFIFPIRQIILQYAILLIGFIIGNSAFIVFELIHNFPNTRTALEFILRGGKTVSPRSYDPLWLLWDIGRIMFEAALSFRGVIVNILFIGSMLGFLYWLVKQIQTNRKSLTKFWLMLFWVVLGIYGVGLYQGRLLDHYFGYLLPVPFILMGLTLDYLFRIKFLKPIFLIGVVMVVYIEISGLYFWKEPNDQLKQTKEIDQIILNLAGNDPYNFALITPGNSDHAYRYFLEIWGRSPVIIKDPLADPERETVTDQLIVVCEGDPNCKPLGHPLWEVAGFGRGEIVAKETGPAGIVVYKLIHYKGE